MEEMLKSWFPNVKLPEQPLAAQTEEPGPTKKLKVKSWDKKVGKNSPSLERTQPVNGYVYMQTFL